MRGKACRSFRLKVFGRGFESHRLHHLTIQGSPMKCKSPLKTGAFSFFCLRRHCRTVWTGDSQPRRAILILTLCFLVYKINHADKKKSVERAPGPSSQERDDPSCRSPSGRQNDPDAASPG